MKPSITSLAATLLFSAAALLPTHSQAGFNGDTVWANFNGLGSTLDFGYATVGSGVEFTGQQTDGFGQIWNFSIDIFDTGVTLSWTESTRSGEPNGGNISSPSPDAYNFDLWFASATVPSMALAAFSSSGSYSPLTPSLTHLYSNDEYSLHAGFSRLDSTDSYTIAAVPEPESWAMLLAGLGIMGGMARRRVSAPA